MLRFESPQFLYLLIAIPLFYVLYFFYVRSKKRKLKDLASTRVQEIIMPDLSVGKQNLKFALLNIAFFFLKTASISVVSDCKVARSD